MGSGSSRAYHVTAHRHDSPLFEGFDAFAASAVKNGKVEVDEGLFNKFVSRYKEIASNASVSDEYNHQVVSSQALSRAADAHPDVFQDGDVTTFIRSLYYSDHDHVVRERCELGPPSPTNTLRRCNTISIIGSHLHSPTLDLASVTDSIDTWGFDTLAVGSATKHPLVLVGSLVLSAHGFIEKFVSNSNKLIAFLLSIDESYLDNPYHNNFHGADVCQTIHYFIINGVGDHISDIERLSALIAALAHDVGHPGVNNGFLMESRDPLVILFNDHSPLESMHASMCFRILAQEQCNFLEGLSNANFKLFRHTAVEMILATDNARHGEVLGKLKTKLSKGPVNIESNSLLVLQICLHAADVSNAAKPMPIYAAWTERVMTEFYAQGDIERERGMPVTPIFDRNKPIPEEKFQAGFILGLVSPLYTALSQVEGVKISECVKTLEANLQHYQHKVKAKDPGKPSPTPEKVSSPGGQSPGFKATIAFGGSTLSPSIRTLNTESEEDYVVSLTPVEAASPSKRTLDLMDQRFAFQTPKANASKVAPVEQVESPTAHA